MSSNRGMVPYRGAVAGVSGSVPAERNAHAGSTERLRFVFDPLRLILFALIVFAVGRVQEALPLLGKLRPGLALVAAAGAYAFLRPAALTKANLFKYWPPRRVVLLGLIACASAVFGLSLGGSASFILQKYAKTIATCLLLIAAVRNASDLYTLVWGYAVSCGVLAYFSIFVFDLTGYASLAMRLDNLYTYDANDLCVVLVIGLAAVLLLMQVAKGPSRLILLGILVGIAASFARSGSRGGFIGLVVFGIAALFLVNSVSSARKLALLAVVGLGVGLFAPHGYWEQMGTLLDPKDDYNYSDPNGRRELAKRGLQYFMAYPVFGVGIDNFGRAECEISGGHVEEGQLRCSAPHNSYVQAAAETGAPGLIVWVSLIFGGIFALLRLRGRLPRTWRRGNSTERFLYSATHFLALGLIGFAVTAFFVSFAWLDTLYVLVAYVTGLYISIDTYKKSTGAGARATNPVAPTITRHTPGWRVLASTRSLQT